MGSGGLGDALRAAGGMRGWERCWGSFGDVTEDAKSRSEASWPSHTCPGVAAPAVRDQSCSLSLCPSKLQPKGLNLWGNPVTQVVLPHKKVCRGLSPYQGVSLAAGTSQQPLRSVETDPVVRPELLLSSALPISTKISSSHGAPAQHLPESSQSPDPCLGLSLGSLMELTLGTAELSCDRAGL